METDLEITGTEFQGFPLEKNTPGFLQFKVERKEQIPFLLKALLASGSVYSAQIYGRDLETLYFRIKGGKSMNKRAAKAIINKDIRAIGSNIQLWLPMLIVPLVFSLVLPLVLVLPARFTDLSTMGNIEQIVKLFSKLSSGPLQETIMALPLAQQQIVYFTVNYLFAPFFLIIPLMVASIIGANSFAGEKERKTLETLLFAPLDLNTLLWAKILAAFLPATFLTLICSFLYGITVNIAAYPLFGRIIFPEKLAPPLALGHAGP